MKPNPKRKDKRSHQRTSTPKRSSDTTRSGIETYEQSQTGNKAMDADSKAGARFARKVSRRRNSYRRNPTSPAAVPSDAPRSQNLKAFNSPQLASIEGIPERGPWFESFYKSKYTPQINSVTDVDSRVQFQRVFNLKHTDYWSATSTSWTNLNAIILSAIDTVASKKNYRDWDATQRTQAAAYLTNMLAGLVQIIGILGQAMLFPTYTLASGADTSPFWTLQGTNNFLQNIVAARLPCYDWLLKLAHWIADPIQVAQPIPNLYYPSQIMLPFEPDLELDDANGDAYDWLVTVKGQFNGLIHLARIGIPAPRELTVEDLTPKVRQIDLNELFFRMQFAILRATQSDGSTHVDIATTSNWYNTVDAAVSVTWEGDMPPDYWALAPLFDGYSANNEYGLFETSDTLPNTANNCHIRSMAAQVGTSFTQWTIDKAAFITRGLWESATRANFSVAPITWNAFLNFLAMLGHEVYMADTTYEQAEWVTYYTQPAFCDMLLGGDTIKIP